MSVSRQTVSKWEINQAYPEILKLLELAEIFHFTLNELLKVNIEHRHNIFSEVGIIRVPSFCMGRYIVISPNPESDVQVPLKQWAEERGLNDVTEENPVMIGWDFPFVSAEQQNCFGLRGYAGAYVFEKDRNTCMTFCIAV